MSYNRRAEVYEVEYAEERDRDFVLSLIGETSRVLEVPCGAGRLSRWIAAKAAELTVVDIEPNMVVRALNSACPGARARLGGSVADMRTLDLGREYDLALIPREALQLLTPADGARALAAVGSHLRPDGLMLVDLATFNDARGAPDPDYYGGAAADGAWRDNWTRRLDAAAELTRRSRQTSEKDAILFELDYCIHRDGRETATWRSEMRLFRYDRSLVEAAPRGLSLIAIYGEYDRTNFSAAASRLLALYQKSA